MEPRHDRRWSVGELAKASGLTVRALHHWDAIGLLCPSERTHAGHRRYAARDVERLYRVLALRRLGLPLEEIGGVLDREGPDLRGAVDRHLERVEQALQAQTALRDRLVRLRDALDRDGIPSGEELIDTIEVMAVHEQYYSEEQLTQLAERAEQLGPEGMEQAQRDWAELYAKLGEAKDAGTDPADPGLAPLAAKYRELIAAFTGGDAGIQASLQRLYDTEGVEQASHGMVDPELDAYAKRVLAAS